MLVLTKNIDSLPGALGLIVLLVTFAIIAIFIIARVSLFKKCGQAGWKAIIPFYGDYVFTRNICKLHWAWYLVLLLIDLCIITTAPAVTVIRLVIKAISFYNLALKCHNDPIPSLIFGGLFSEIVTCIYGFGSYVYDDTVEVKSSGLF